MKIRSFWFILSIALLATAQVRADSITLKTGEKLTGTIKNETDTDVTIDIPISASINDERDIQKSDIASIDKAQPDQIAYQQLIQTQPNPNFSLTADAYTDILLSLSNFQTNFPTSTYIPQIKQLAAEFQAEKDKVDAGQFKYLGQWISQTEALKRRIQIDAQQIYVSMQQQASSGDYVGAMQTFGTIELNYKTTRIYPPAVVLAQQILAYLIPDLVNRLQNIRNDAVQMKRTIAFTAEPEKSNLIAQNKAEQDRDTAIIAGAIHSGVKWVPLIPNSEVSVTTLQKVASAEAQSLAAVPVATMMQSLARTDAARAALAARDYNTANSDLTAATTLWSQNEDARYALTQLKAALATPTPAATPPPTPTPEPEAAATPPPQMVTIITPTPVPVRPFYMTIPGAVAIVVLLLILGGVGAVIAKKRGSEFEDA